MATWKPKYKVDLLSNQMEEIKNVSTDGKISFRGFEYQNLIVLLDSMVDLDKRVPKIEKRSIVNQAIFNAGDNIKINPSSILTEIGKLEVKYLSKSEQKYELLTEISLGRTCQVSKIYFDGAIIVVHDRPNETFIAFRKKQLEKAKRSIAAKLPYNYAATGIDLAKMIGKSVNATGTIDGKTMLVTKVEEVVEKK